uniref:Uncharacterized protein n=1 Tax=Anopheles culicifacies TaxID=139723 RepID=A0A182LUI3_9DIPT
MKSIRIVLFLVLVFGGMIHTAPLLIAERRALVGQARGAGVIGFPSLFHDIKHQFGSIGHDLRKLITSLMGATQVVYWKPPFRRQPERRVDTSDRQQTLNRIPRLTTTTRQPTTRQSRRKKAYTGDDEFDDFFSLDSLGFW